MSKLEPAVLAAIITSVISLIVSLVSLFGGRANERKKLMDAIRQQEVLSRMTSLQQSIEIIQKVKNELRDLIDFLNRESRRNQNEISSKAGEVLESVRNYLESFRSTYASGLSSLREFESGLLHDLTKYLLMIKETVSQLKSERKHDQATLERLITKLTEYRNKLSQFQDQYRQFREDIIKQQKI